MTAPARIGAFVAGLVVAFGAAFGIGAAVGPWDENPAPTHGTSTEVNHDGH